MKRLLLPVVFSFFLPFHFSTAQEVSYPSSVPTTDCSLLEKLVAQIDQTVGSLTSQYKLARINGSGNLKDLQIRLETAKEQQVYFHTVLAQCLQD
ncbi:MAG: hypothetical protein IPK04_20500 [Bdellovibrionales bacterium]|jgi:hypothetical protein|nr:hypothetical protein [Bdellovibrionales bacterium]MBL7671660.1 hypothetical protein [Pseudobdellovibrionaceae bacterium]